MDHDGESMGGIPLKEELVIIRRSWRKNPILLVPEVSFRLDLSSSFLMRLFRATCKNKATV